MTHILTLISSSQNVPLNNAHFKEISKIIMHYNMSFTSRTIWLDDGKAAEVNISNSSQSSLDAHLREILANDKIDFFITPKENRRKKLLIADMDSTIATSETLDELADHAGIKNQISEITALAMEGRLDFHEALQKRVSLLKGLNISAIKETLEKTQLNVGAKTFVQTMMKNGAISVLVSGGFTQFTQDIANQCGFNFNHGNILEIENETLTGNVTQPILDKHSKVGFLENYIKDLNLSEYDCLSIGDGANDLPMLKMAGLGIGYHPKNTVKSEIGNCILYGDLTAALYAQGYSSKDFE